MAGRELHYQEASFLGFVPSGAEAFRKAHGRQRVNCFHRKTAHGLADQSSKQQLPIRRDNAVAEPSSPLAGRIGIFMERRLN
jgi:hypothetical protein